MTDQEKAHCQRFNELDEHTKVFLESLSADDVLALKDGIALTKATKTMGRFWKWTFIFVVTVFAGMATIGQSIKWLWEHGLGRG